MLDQRVRIEGMADVPQRWQCSDCGTEVVSRDVAWVAHARATHACYVARAEQGRYDG